MWLHKRTAVLADEQGMGKTASAVAYISSLLHEFEVTAPVLVVVPSNMLSFWEGKHVGLYTPACLLVALLVQVFCLISIYLFYCCCRSTC